MIVNPKNCMCLTRMVKKFEYWRPHLGRPRILVPPNFVMFYLFLMFSYLKNFKCLAQKVKKFEFFAGQFGSKTPIIELPIFVRFSLFSIFTFCENLFHTAVMV